MGLYALCLAGSNYIAPVICGFIAEYHGWRWVFYWPSIFLGCAIIFLFFFCEETNYAREHVGAPVPARTKSSTVSEQSDHEKASPKVEIGAETDNAFTSKKSYLKKLSLWGPRQNRNTTLRRLWQILYHLSWPVIFYAGYVFCIGQGI